MKKGVLTLAILAGLNSISIVSAETNFEVLGNKIASGLSALFAKIGATPTSSTAILMGILLFMIIYSVIKKVEIFQSDDPTMSFLWSGGIALVVTILAIMYLPENMIEIIGPQFGGMGATILTMIPFIIMFYFTVFAVDSLVLARLTWIVFAVYCGIIYVNKISMSKGWSEGTGWSGTGPYIAGFFLSLLMFIFIYQFRKKFYREILMSKKEKGIRRIQKAKAGADILATATDEFSHGGGI